MKNPVYIMECTSHICSFEIRVNDVWAVSEFHRKDVSLQFPINNLILETGNQMFSLRVLQFPLDGKDIASLNIRILRYEVDLPNNDYSSEPIECINYVHRGKNNFVELFFEAQVPYQVDAWQNSLDLTQMAHLPSLILSTINEYRSMIRDGRLTDFLSCIVQHDNHLATCLYWELTEEQKQYRIDDFKGLLESEYLLALPDSTDRLEFYGYGHLVRYVKPNGESAICLRNDDYDDEYRMDLYFYMPKGSNKLQLI